MQRTSGPVTTDALFASATKNGTSLTRFAVSEATVFRWMDEEMLSASAPVTMTFNRQNASLAVCEIDSLAKTSSITLKLGGAASSVVLNGTPLPFTSNGTGIVSFTVDR